jgi:hypothetical protein
MNVNAKRSSATPLTRVPEGSSPSTFAKPIRCCGIEHPDRERGLVAVDAWTSGEVLTLSRSRDEFDSRNVYQCHCSPIGRGDALRTHAVSVRIGPVVPISSVLRCGRRQVVRPKVVTLLCVSSILTGHPSVHSHAVARVAWASACKAVSTQVQILPACPIRGVGHWPTTCPGSTTKKVRFLPSRPTGCKSTADGRARNSEEAGAAPASLTIFSWCIAQWQSRRPITV